MKNLIITTLLALGALGFGGNAGALGTPSGTSIENIGLFEFTEPDGTTGSSQTTPVSITVSQVSALDIGPSGTVAAPGQTVTGAPGSTGVLTYTVTNNGNGSDTIDLSTTVASGTASSVTIYADTDGDGKYTPGTDQPASSVALAANESATVFVVVGVPSNAAGTSTISVNLSGTTTATATPATDSNNVGAVTATSTVSFTLADDHTTSVNPGGSVTLTHTLANTGNVPLDGAALVASSTLGGTTSASQSVTYTVTTSSGGTGTGSSLDAALAAAGSIPIGGTATISAVYVTSTSAADASTYTNTISIYSEQTGANLTNNVPSTAPVSDVDSFTVARGVASVSKVGDGCGTDPTCASPVAGTTTIKPGEYIRYTVTVNNTGSGTLAFPTLRDYVPANTSFHSVSGSSTPSGTLLYSIDRSNWTASAPSALATSTSSTSGPFVYVGMDSNGDGKVDSSDTLAAGQTMRLIITVKVN